MTRTLTLLIFVVTMVVLAQGDMYQHEPSSSVSIPFDFMVGRHMFVAGEYGLIGNGGDKVEVRSRHGIAAALVPADAAAAKRNELPSLIFVRHGHDYKLVRACANHDIGHLLQSMSARSLVVINSDVMQSAAKHQVEPVGHLRPTRLAQ
jgi:hypothetical protein